MDLNQFLKADCEKSVRLIKSTQFLVDELLSDAIKDQDFDGCVEIAGSVITNCKELKRMHRSEQGVQLHEIAAQFLSKGLNVSTIKRSIK
ncbi:YqaH family protein [Bacillus sp. WP8]|uniref:YqaH family protein n=1 Tax=Bacillus sp. WP8 TaxID=756828 RepID=UPI0011A41EB1|nr:YqaH family protein [Bacillus sp. WP8]